jgi:hypothetical protein
MKPDTEITGIMAIGHLAEVVYVPVLVSGILIFQTISIITEGM